MTRAIERKPLYLGQWLPFRMWTLANEVGEAMEGFYNEKFGLTRVGWQALAVIAEHEPLSASELALKMHVDNVQAARAIGHLTELSMISRRTDSRDKRRVVLRVAKTGWAAYWDIVPRARALGDTLTKDLSAQELKVFSELLERMESRGLALFATPRP